MQPTDFLKSIQTLYKQIESWVEDKPLQTTREGIELNEEAYGQYKTEKLVIRNATTEQLIASLIPKGAAIIGAKGRIDLAGNVDSEILVDWDKGGPSYTSKVVTNEQEQPGKAVPLYRGVDKAGWYWVESRKLARAHHLDKAVFMDLLASVSDGYESGQ